MYCIKLNEIEILKIIIIFYLILLFLGPEFFIQYFFRPSLKA